MKPEHVRGGRLNEHERRAWWRARDVHDMTSCDVEGCEQAAQAVLQVPELGRLRACPLHVRQIEREHDWRADVDAVPARHETAAQALEAHPRLLELVKAAQRRRIRELEEELANARIVEPIVFLSVWGVEDVCPREIGDELGLSDRRAHVSARYQSDKPGLQLRQGNREWFEPSFWSRGASNASPEKGEKAG